MKVRIMLMIIRTIAPLTGSLALKILIPVRLCNIRLMGRSNSSVKPMPIRPAPKPTIMVSALKTLAISFFDAPMERRIPISFVLSSTDIGYDTNHN